jgi:hypothetical protein
MGVSLRFRLVPAVALAALLVVGASPVLGFSSVTQTGTYGDWGVEDNAQVGQEGARCYYNNGTGSGSLLERVRVRPPTIWGAHSKMTWVGWRFKILRSTDNGVSYQPIYTSSIWKDKANLTTNADGFTFKNWYPAHALAPARIRVQVTLFWYKPGTKTKVQGKAVGQDDNYSYQFENSALGGVIPYCLTVEA